MVTSEELTCAERCFILRRRLGLNLREAAKYFNVSPTYRYQRYELAIPGAIIGVDINKLLAITPLPRELCIIARRRTGLSQAQVGEELGFTKLWIGRMENGVGNPDPLVKWWNINYTRFAEVDW